MICESMNSEYVCREAKLSKVEGPFSEIPDPIMGQC